MKNKLLAIIFFILVILDQLTKSIFSAVKNSGTFFGIFPNRNSFFILLSLIAILILSYFVFNSKHEYNKYKFPLIIIISGILGNLIDRIFFNGIRDFIDFKVWPVFNLADAFIVMGVFFLILTILNKK